MKSNRKGTNAKMLNPNVGIKNNRKNRNAQKTYRINLKALAPEGIFLIIISVMIATGMA
jgi:hypothetical protein